MAQHEDGGMKAGVGGWGGGGLGAVASVDTDRH